eukprot:1188670-Prorocentrum_minimum.AAC.1
MEIPGGGGPQARWWVSATETTCAASTGSWLHGLSSGEQVSRHSAERGRDPRVLAPGRSPLGMVSLESGQAATKTFSAKGGRSSSIMQCM